MLIETADLAAAQVYHLTTQTLLPRPIAWVLSEHTEGHYNLAPFSYFTAVSSKPPLLMFSVGDKAPGTAKDTKANIGLSDRFVVHIPTVKQAAAVTESSRALPANQSELNQIAENLVSFGGDFPLPRLQQCPVAYGCRLHQLQQIEGAPQTLVFGLIEQVYIADRCARQETVTKADGSTSERLTVDATEVDPLARLGASQYGSLGQVFTIPRPR